MNSPSLKRIGIFVNANGSNEYAEKFLPLFAQYPDAVVTIVSLAERLPEYARFPNQERKQRLEELIDAAAQSAVKEFTEAARQNGLHCEDPVVLRGRFPSAIVEWVESSNIDLLVKESLPCDGVEGHASKGDIKLTRQSSVPVLLAHSRIQNGDPVLVGVAPRPDNTTLDRLFIEMIELSAQWAKLLGSTLCIVHAWDLWGVGFLSSRVPAEEIATAIAEAESKAKESVERVLSKCDLDGVVPEEPLMGRGDPGRVIADAIDTVKPGLVVLGSIAREGVTGALLGNTAESIARKRQTSVLIVR